VAAVLVAVVAGCGGGGGHGKDEFDEAALRAAIVERSPSASADLIDRTVRVVRHACTSDDRAAMPQLRSEDPDGFALAEIACPAKAAAAAG
jgi:hypothetical protein